MAGLCLLAVIVLAVAVKLKSSRNGDAEPPVVAQSEPPAAESATPATAANGPAAEPASGGKSVYTENLVPPPDSYVD